MFALVSNFEEESLEGEGDGTYGFRINLSRLAAIGLDKIKSTFKGMKGNLDS
jgi:hypothetical protein